MLQFRKIMDLEHDSLEEAHYAQVQEFNRLQWNIFNKTISVYDKSTKLNKLIILKKPITLKSISLKKPIILKKKIIFDNKILSDNPVKATVHYKPIMPNFHRKTQPSIFFSEIDSFSLQKVFLDLSKGLIPIVYSPFDILNQHS